MTTIPTSGFLSTAGSGAEQVFTTYESDAGCSGIVSVGIDGQAATADATIRVYQWSPDASYRALAWEGTIDADHRGVLSPPLLIGPSVTGLTFGITTTDAMDWPLTVFKEAQAITAVVNDVSPTAIPTGTTEIGSGSFTGGLYQSLLFFNPPLDTGEELHVRDVLAGAFSNNHAHSTDADETMTSGFYTGVVLYGVPLPAVTDWATYVDRVGGTGDRDVYRQMFQIVGGP